MQHCLHAGATSSMIRPAHEADLPGILTIYNDVIMSSRAIYTDHPVPLEERQVWLDARRAQGYPVLVAVEGSDVTGFAFFADFRPWPSYRHTVEHTVHVRSDRRGIGIGNGLVRELFPIAMALGKHVMIPGVDAANEGSLRFHERLGFEKVAHLKEVGHKFGRWLDLVFLQRFLA
jgi:L-amino acid N-acyltransferase YncA